MALAFSRNNAKGPTDGTGKWLFIIKEMMVDSGRWTVIGSGDGSGRYAYVDVTAGLSGAQQGSGGAYDCLQSGTGLDAVVAGNWNANGWCVLRDELGRCIMFVSSSGTPVASWGGYGRIAYSRIGAFDGSVAAAATIPGAASDEQWIYGSRAVSTGGDIFVWNSSRYLHFFCDDTAIGTVASFGWYHATTTGTGVQVFMMLGARDSEAQQPIFMAGGSATFTGWEGPGDVDAVWSTSFNSDGSLGAQFPVEPQQVGGVNRDVLVRFSVFMGTNVAQPLAADGGSPEWLVYAGVSSRAYPNIFEDDNGMTWVGLVNNYVAPWGLTADAPGTPLGGTSTTYTAKLYQPSISGESVELVSQALGSQESYVQRVWDAGSGGRWCYYEKTEIDPTPLSSETNPNYTGAISNHSVVSVRLT